MPVTSQWDNDQKTIIRYEVEGRWTWDEFYKAYEQTKIMMQNMPTTVHFIMLPLDTVSRNYLPPGALTHILSIYRKPFPNSGSTVTIGGGTFARAMMSVLGRIAPKVAEKFTFANSLEEARAILAKRISQQSAPAARK